MQYSAETRASFSLCSPRQLCRVAFTSSGTIKTVGGRRLVVNNSFDYPRRRPSATSAMRAAYLARAISAARYAPSSLSSHSAVAPLHRRASQKSRCAVLERMFIYRDDTPSARSTGGGGCISGYRANKCIARLITRPPQKTRAISRLG